MSDQQPPNVAADTDNAAIWTFGIGAIYLVLAGVLLFGSFVKLGFPFIFQDWGMASWGRLWPMTILTLVFGAATFLHLGSAHFLLPRLTGTAPGGPLERFTPIISGVLVAVAILAVGFGFGDGRPGFESPVWGDLLIALALAGPAVAAIRSVLGKREATIYPSLWYLTGGLIAAIAAILVANFPLTEATGSFVQTAFGRGTVLWGWVVAGGVGSAMYLVPRVTGRPLFSRQLAIITFFSLLLPGMFYGLSTHLLGPVPDWAEAVGIGMRFALVLPAVTIPAGLLLSGEGALDRLRHSEVLRLVAAGTALVSIALLVSAVTAFPSVQTVIGLTTFDLGTELLAIAGALLLGTAMAFHAFPRITGRELVGDGAVWHLRLTVLGTVGSTLLLWIAGVSSGITWRAGAESGSWQNVGEGFTQTLDTVWWMYQVLPLTGLAFLGGQVLVATTLWRTWTVGTVTATEAVIAEPATAAPADDQEVEA